MSTTSEAMNTAANKLAELEKQHAQESLAQLNALKVGLESFYMGFQLPSGYKITPLQFSNRYQVSHYDIVFINTYKYEFAVEYVIHHILKRHSEEAK